jgi:hypothetical protein
VSVVSGRQLHDLVCLKHHVAMQAIFIAYYNFARKHETLKGNSPAMASGLTDHVWSVKELLENAAG